jgi:hypothetical protein
LQVGRLEPVGAGYHLTVPVCGELLSLIEISNSPHTGLMGGIGLEGSKITKITPNE